MTVTLRRAAAEGQAVHVMPLTTMERQVAVDLDRRKGRYGIDAPYLLPIPMVFVVINIFNAVIAGTAWPLVPAAIMMVCIGCGLYTSRRGKFEV